MQLRTRGIILMVVGTIAIAFLAGYLGARIPKQSEPEPHPPAPEVVYEEPERIEMDTLEYKIQEQVESKFKPYQQKLESWEKDKKSIGSRLVLHEKKLNDLESADRQFQGVVEQGMAWIRRVEQRTDDNKKEIQTVREDLGPGDKHTIRMFYTNEALESKFNLSAYNNSLYVDDLLSVVEEWQKNPVNRIAILRRPSGKGEAVFFSGADNSFGVEILWDDQGMDKLVMLSSVDSIPTMDTVGRTEAVKKLRELFAQYRTAYLLPFRQLFKSPAVALLFGEKPDTGRYQGKHYVR